MTQFHKTSSAMRLIDIHTHAPGDNNRHAILDSDCYIHDKSISLGIHPWHITDCWQQQIAAIEESATKENVIAIGECGLDKLKSPANIELQKEIFRSHALLAEKAGKPLIIHCVKAYDELIAMHKDVSPLQAWIIHGFRGKPEQAVQLVRVGFYISLGEQFNPDSAKTIPTDRLFIESDESHSSITDIYTMVAQAKGITAMELAQHTAQNAVKCNIIL